MIKGEDEEELMRNLILPFFQSDLHNRHGLIYSFLADGYETYFPWEAERLEL